VVSGQLDEVRELEDAADAVERAGAEKDAGPADAVVRHGARVESVRLDGAGSLHRRALLVVGNERVGLDYGVEEVAGPPEADKGRVRKGRGAHAVDPHRDLVV